MTISEYQSTESDSNDTVVFPTLHGTRNDENRMFEALQAASFEVTLHDKAWIVTPDGQRQMYTQTQSPRTKQNIVHKFEEWMSTIENGDDVLLYFGCHGVHFHGTQWVVPCGTSIHPCHPGDIVEQCIQIDWFKTNLSKHIYELNRPNDPMIKILVIDCCDTEITSMPSYLSDDSRCLCKIIGMSDFNASNAALNIKVFHGAALGTAAMSRGDGGVFTNAFVDLMQQGGMTLDQLGRSITDSITADRRDTNFKVGDRIIVSKELESNDASGLTVHPGRRGIIAEVDDYQIHIKLSDTESCKISVSACKRNLERILQIVTTETSTTAELADWCFHDACVFPLCSARQITDSGGADIVLGPSVVSNMLILNETRSYWIPSNLLNEGTYSVIELSDMTIEQNCEDIFASIVAD